VVEDGMRAISVRINDVLGVAGFVLPGDRVDIMLTRDGYTDILLQNVKILAMDQPADERLGKPKTGKTATVEVNSVDAQKLTLAETAGSLSLALRAAGSVPAAAPRRIKLKDIGPAYEVWINEMGREFNRHAPETLPFYPYTRCAGLYATLCYDGDGTLIR
jgi:pilus assembly protein CpaB